MYVVYLKHTDYKQFLESIVLTPRTCYMMIIYINLIIIETSEIFYMYIISENVFLDIYSEIYSSPELQTLVYAYMDRSSIVL